MHAAELARELGIKKIILPPIAGVLSALGMLMADCVKDYQQAIFVQVSLNDNGTLDRALSQSFDELVSRGIEEFKTEGFSEDQLIFRPMADVRFVGQSWELSVPYKMGSLEHDFFDAHRNLYGYVPEGRDWEVVNVRVQIIGKRNHPELGKLFNYQIKSPAKPCSEKRVYWREKFWKTPFFHFDEISQSQKIEGPAVILDPYTTIWVPPDFYLQSNNIGGLELCPR